MRPKWYKIKDMPYDEMWLDDPIWFAWYLKGGPQFKGYFLYKGLDTIIEQDMRSTDIPQETISFI